MNMENKNILKINGCKVPVPVGQENLYREVLADKWIDGCRVYVENDEVKTQFSETILKEGDIVSIDVGATFRGLVGDGAWTYPVGKVSDECLHLMEVTKNALFAGIKQMIPDNKLENVSAAIEDVALEGKVGIVRQYGGHGVGREMHEDPFLFNYRTNSNVIIKKNCAIAIEPMLNLGCDEVHTLSDGWTVITDDNRPSAHFEHTVVASEDGPLIMTELL